MTDNSSELDLDSVCKDLSSAFQGVLSWKWDSRFDSVLGEFKRDKEDHVCSILEHNFTSVWDKGIIGSATSIEQATSEHLGGLMSNQLLFTTDPKLGAITFCAWWPWGDGKTISIRIGSSLFILGESDDLETIAAFRAWFEV